MHKPCKLRQQAMMRRLKIDVAKFLADYNDAHASDMTVRDFCAVTGLHISTLHGRLRTLAQRGVRLPLLKGMKKRTKMGRMLGACPPQPREERAPAVEPVAAPETVEVASFQIFVCSGL